ncbi:hypothetical protein LCGC14_2899320 [marine sediment metagenome]|uniref:Uncharacterized protein n=1 Tax=marine sediment metagenome TaxID=412755 RepID=A0A0F9AL49_9ZZZZ
MRLLNDEEIEPFINELTGVGLSGIEYRTEYDVDGLLKAQRQFDLKWMIATLGLCEDEMGFCEISNHVLYPESLKQWEDKTIVQFTGDDVEE